MRVGRRSLTNFISISLLEELRNSVTMAQVDLFCDDVVNVHTIFMSLITVKIPSPSHT
jgi:hypothetical protein